jgi:hypothetical protein
VKLVDLDRLKWPNIAIFDMNLHGECVPMVRLSDLQVMAVKRDSMGDLISRKTAIEYLMTNMGWRNEDGYEVDDADEKKAIITDLVNGIPDVDAVPVEWLRQEAMKDDGLINSVIRGLLAKWWQEKEAGR